ncbi:MAG: hypothetical protein AAGA87_14920 [Pseudomonadota bacterium]
MKDDSDERESISLGVFGARTGFSGLTQAEVIALSLSALWLLAVTIFFFVVGGTGEAARSDPIRGLMIVFAVFMPVALIWIACIAASSARVVKDESARLQAALDSMRQAYVAQQQAAGTLDVKPSVERKLDELVQAQKKTGEVIATFASARQLVDDGRMPQVPATAQAPAGAEPMLALADEQQMSEPVSIDDFIMALNFPETPEDEDGLSAMKRVMKDRRAAELIHASRDILTLLSQEGIYMDDLEPDRARPEIWRMFAGGERGRSIAPLGGIRDRSGVALTAARMRQDHIFRDTAHHFLRKFDHTFSAFETEATDAEIVALADTRTARAFMLLGRVAGTFD